MLEQSYDLAQAKQELERREQRIGVLNRTLRHNIRNETNVILGHLRDVLEAGDLDEQTRERIRVTLRNVERILRTSEKARHAEATLSENDLERVDLEGVVAASVDRLTERYPGADIATSTDDARTVLVDKSFDEAVDELLENAVRHQTASPPRVEVSAAATEDIVRLEVTNPGDPIPENDRRALATGEETPLIHGQGFGLWMVKWIVENSNGWLRFPQADGECRVRIELPRVPAGEPPSELE